MKVAELFAELGFKIEGKAKLDDVDRGLASAEVNARKFALRLIALSAGMVAMIKTAMTAGQALRNFGLSTGLSSEELQRWQVMAEANGIAADQLTDSIKALQTARTNFALGEPEAMGAWSMLGVDPRQDPFAVMKSLRARASQFQDQGVFRNLMGRVGMEGMIPMLKGSDEEFAKWSKFLVTTKAESDALAKLNAEWAKFRLGLAAVKNQLVSGLAPALTYLLKGLTWVTEQLGKFTHFLQQSTPAANFLRTALQIIVPLVIALGTAFAAAFALGPLLAFIGPLAKALGVASLLLLALDDIITSLRGGKAVTREWGEAFGEWLSQFKQMEKIVNGTYEMIEKIKGAFNKNSTDARKWQHVMAERQGQTFTGGAGGSWAVNNDIKIQIDGSKDPKATGREVRNAMDQQYRTSMDTAAAPGY